MTTRWSGLTEIFNAALEREPQGRARFLDEACGADQALRAEVESLLASHERAGDFLERPAVPPAGVVAAPDAAAHGPGERIGPYRIEREIGRGGMGVVYLAEDTRLGRRVALKVIAPAAGGDEARRERLRREARAAAALSHPAIATVFSFEEIEGQACLVTEYVRGDTLRQEIARGPLPLDLVIDTGIQVAHGLAAAHAAGVVHRDLKPENVIRNRQGAVKILDFGIASLEATSDAAVERLTGAGLIVGTPGYMSPEQIDGADVDARSDIFALGVLLFELATGTHPFISATPGATAARVLAADPASLETFGLGLPAGLDAIVRGCTKRHRADRFAGAMDVARALEDLRGPRASQAPFAPARSPGVDASSPLWWWRAHQLGAMAVEGGLVYGVWRVHATLHSDWSLAIFLAYVVSGALNGTLRAHLLVTTIFNLRGVGEQLRRATPLVRGTDLVVALIVIASAASVAQEKILLPAVLVAFGVGWAVTSWIAEPATRKAAFGEIETSPSPRPNARA